MKNNLKTGLLLSSVALFVVTMSSCGNKSATETTTTNEMNSDSLKAAEQGNTTVFGNEMDTTNAADGGPIQAPPSGTVTMPASVTVRK